MFKCVMVKKVLILDIQVGIHARIILLNDSDRKNCYEQVNIVFSLGHLCLKHRRYSRQGKYCVVDPGFKGIISPGWPGIIEGCPSRRWRKWR